MESHSSPHLARGAEARIRRLVADAIARTGLDLRGRCVLTEAATGHYQLTPLIAAESGAERVFAMARDSRFGAAGEVARALSERAASWGLAERIVPLFAREDPALAKAEIVTNLGHVRPIDAALLERLAPGAVVALMWETWEFRAEDVDRAACRRLGVPLLGTDEHHPDLDIFAYVGPLAARLIGELGIELVRGAVVVAGAGEFAALAVGALERAGARVVRVDTAVPGALAGAKEALRRADALLLIDHVGRRMLLGEGGEIAPADLAALNPGIAIAHLCGGADRDACLRAGLVVAPARFAAPGHMSLTTDHLGPRPLIDLHAAGLRVGQAMREATLRGLRGEAAEAWALAHCPYAQAFGHADGAT